MNDITAIEVENISKYFELHHQDLGNNAASKNWMTALNNVSFKINQGSAVGVIGSNGSGKSTLLRILSGVSKPSSGQITIRGKTAGILEIGAGFYPELSGRENLFLYGNLNGFSKSAISKKFDAILDFSEIGRFIDEPVKNYSNGMYLRLAFSIMIHLDFDIYLLDEVLSVGDTAFRNKIKIKIEALKKLGKTLLYVSHNMGEIMQDFKYALILHKGELVFYGNSIDAVRKYVEMDLHHQEQISKPVFSPHPVLNNQLLLQSVKVVAPKSNITTNDEIHLEFTFEKKDAVLNEFIMGVVLLDTLLHPVFTTIAHAETQGRTLMEAPGHYRLQCVIPSCILASGIFSVDIYFSNPENLNQQVQIKNAVKFTVKENAVSDLYRYSLGSVRPACHWKTLVSPNMKSK